MSPDFTPRHKDDFGRVYDLEDPRPYFRALQGSDYRMPGALCRFLRRIRPRITAARGKKTLRILDFAGGYGTNGALLKHRLSMRELYARFERGTWLPVDGRANWNGDRRFFEARRRSRAGFEVCGLDIATTALEYALCTGLNDRVFSEDLSAGPPSATLRAYAATVDIVVESGSLGAVLSAVFPRLARAGARDAPPWFLYCPRPDVDWRPLDSAWEALDYAPERCNRDPVRYRKPFSADEAAEMARLARALGAPSPLHDGYLVVDLVLARPKRDAQAYPVSELVAGTHPLG